MTYTEQNKINILSIYIVYTYQNGKQQVRRLGIAPNNRAIYITTHKHYPQGRFLEKLKQGVGSDYEMALSSGPVKEVDLSRVVRMQLGQQSRRFVKAR